MDLSQTFSRIAFYQILLGIVTFCFAEANPGMLLVAGSLVVLSRYITDGPWGRPLPRWAINLAALGTLAWWVSEWFSGPHNIIITMGHFTMWLQILLLYARKTNREYGQLLMLSLLQMIGASVLSVSIIYGALLGVYCVLALLTFLTFQLKSSSDRVYEANRSAASDQRRVGRPDPVVGRGYRWQFRSATTMIAVICAALAVAVFIAMPRSIESSLLGDTGEGLSPKHVGFNPQVRLDGKPIAGGSHVPVMNLRVELHGEPISSRSWLMRGAALDTYDPFTHTWKRSPEAVSTDRRLRVNKRGLTLAHLPQNVPIVHAYITLRQINHRNLFTYLPMTHFQSDGISSAVFSPRDRQLSSSGPVLSALIYTLRWPLFNIRDLDRRYTDLEQPAFNEPMMLQPNMVTFDQDQYARGWPVQGPRIRSYTLGVLSELGMSRDPFAKYDPADARIAEVLADHLRSTCNYTMDSRRADPEAEPIIEFLFGSRSGHCELFASSLAAMTRSIGMQARIVTGFRASEFNQIGGYYIVRQSDAHAWTEVNLGSGSGWRSYDATPAAEIDRQARQQRTWMTSLREAYEHLEFGWIRSIVAYDVGARRALLSGLNAKLAKSVRDDKAWLGQIVTFVRLLPMAWQLDKTNTAKAVGTVVFVAVVSVFLIRLVVIRRRRMTALKLAALPPVHQRALAKHLAFYMDMTALLRRHGYIRPSWQSPRSYAEDLARNLPGRMDPAVTLTDLFYRVRFGLHTLDEQQRRRAKVYLRQLEKALSGPPRA